MRYFFSVSNALLCLVLMSSHARAEQSAEVKWLMNDPVTIFDLGMKRADESLHKAVDDLIAAHDDILETASSRFASAQYAYGQNSIELSVGAFLGEGAKSPTAERCQKLVNDVQDRLLIGEAVADQRRQQLAQEPPRTTEARAASLVARWFSHQGFERANRPAGIDDKIASLIQIKAQVFLLADSEPSVVCSMPLAGDIVSVTIKKH
jgi:hypothetical protein